MSQVGGAAGTVMSGMKPSLKHRFAEKGIDRMLWLLVPGAVFLILFFVYPFLYGLTLSLTPSGSATCGVYTGVLASYKCFFQDSFVDGWDSIWKTLRLAIPAALFNVVASIPIAYQLRGKFRGKRLLQTLLVIPISLGTVLVAAGLLNFAGKPGWINRFLLLIHVIDKPLTMVYNYWGVLLSLIITGFPFAFLLVSSYMSGIDPSLEQAAALMGAGWWKRFTRILLPLLAPGLATTFMLTFVLAFSVFPSAVLVGNPAGSTRVIAVVAYQAFAEKFDYSLASAVAIIMGLIELLVVGLVAAWRSTLYRGSTGGKG